MSVGKTFDLKIHKLNSRSCKEGCNARGDLRQGETSHCRRMLQATRNVLSTEGGEATLFY